MKKFSVVITHFERERNLNHTLQGLAGQTLLPTEVIIVNMGGKVPQLANYPFRLLKVEYTKSWNHLPLAASRNLGAKNCSTDLLLFLDVDCIPNNTYCELLFSASHRANGALVMGTPRYLLSAKSIETELHTLRKLSVHHPSRPVISGMCLEGCYEMFWSLCFAISKVFFLKMGGFDENYEGYGAEDTDFALKAQKAGVPFYLCDAEVYHQQHSIYVPPLNHLEAIVNNCNLFYEKWGYWAMTDCLNDFEELGYIRWKQYSNKKVKILCFPTQMQLQSHLVKNAPYR